MWREDSCNNEKHELIQVSKVIEVTNIDHFLQITY